MTNPDLCAYPRGSPNVSVNVNEVYRRFPGNSRIDDSVVSFTGESERMPAGVFGGKVNVPLRRVAGPLKGSWSRGDDGDPVPEAFQIASLQSQGDLQATESRRMLVTEESDVHGNS